jgi:hypothetical protein
MSLEAINAVRQMDIRPCGRKFIAMALADYADEEGSCYPSVKTLARYTSQGEKTVRDHLNALEEVGFLTRERSRNNRGELGQYRYKIDYRRNPPVAKSASGEKRQSPAAKSAAHIHQTPSSNEEGNSKRARKRAFRLSEGWTPPAEFIEYAIGQGLSEGQAHAEAEKMRDWSLSSPNGAKLDWPATWRNWIKRVKEKGNGGSKSDNTQRHRSAFADALSERSAGVGGDPGGWDDEDAGPPRLTIARCA